MDAVDPELVDQAEAVLRRVAGVQELETVRLRWVGHRIRAEAAVVVGAELSLVQAHDIATEARHELLHEVPRLVDALVHTSPAGPAGRAHHERTAHHVVST
jgi:divalent metal cation (Fe/Co/Zn/Cd) transporter